MAVAEVRKFHHPGSGRRRTIPFPKGRQAAPEAVEEIRAFLAADPLQRSELIEYLHLIQDRYRRLSAAHLQALAEEMALPMAEVYEVASFYAHFDILLDGEPEPAEITIRVCDSLTCEMMGAEALLAGLPARFGAKVGAKVRVLRAPCMGRCDAAPAAEVGHRHVEHATVDSLAAAAAGGNPHPEMPAYQDLAAYRAEAGYARLGDCLDGRLDVEGVIATLGESGLRGLGGAGFPAGRKWSFVRAEAKPRYLAVNADEGEPGTFKDRYYLERRPHQFLEGALIAAWAVEAEAAYIYLRDEYPAVREILIEEIAAVEAAGLAPHTKVHLRRGAGAYICGEESAMIESIEGKRGLPRHRPPYVSQVGIFGRPTLVNNVETLYWVPEILSKGAPWFAGQGRNGGKGPRSYSVSGRVREPGVKLAPAGITVRELIEEYCGGMAEGHAFKAYLPGGASGGILPAAMGDIPLDFGTLEEHGCFIGSHAVVILSDKDDIKAAARNLMRFFEDESCGQCTPCRNGTEKAVKLMSGATWDAGLLEELAQTMRDASICGLGQAAPNPLTSVLKFFPEDVR
ncbi:MAG: NAD(P)H-dependent oxidoreductase subunit E [Proteobacteria bacterium]|nr:NAD(P)H-dependent oxidoreductase subunit E [Pseudomonadota bacterium]